MKQFSEEFIPSSANVAVHKAVETHVPHKFPFSENLDILEFSGISSSFLPLPPTCSLPVLWLSSLCPLPSLPLSSAFLLLSCLSSLCPHLTCHYPSPPSFHLPSILSSPPNLTQIKLTLGLSFGYLHSAHGSSPNFLAVQE